MKYFYMFIVLFIVRYFAYMSQISFLYIRHATTVVALLRKKG